MTGINPLFYNLPMILGTDELLRLVKDKKLVENLSQRELKNPEGAGFDLRAGELFELSGSGYLGVDERKTPTEKLIAKYETGKTTKVNLKPGKYYMVKTVETVNQPENIQVMVKPRGTLLRSGVYLFSAFGGPGYKGQFNFGLMNLGGLKFTLEMGARIAHFVFFEVKGKTLVPYRGQWQGGRVSARKKEKQI